MENNNENYPEPEHIIQARYTQDNEYFIVFADVLGPSYEAGWHQFSKDGWLIVSSPYGGTKYYKVLDCCDLAAGSPNIMMLWRPAAWQKGKQRFHPLIGPAVTVH